MTIGQPTDGETPNVLGIAQAKAKRYAKTGKRKDDEAPAPPDEQKTRKPKVPMGRIYQELARAVDGRHMFEPFNGFRLKYGHFLLAQDGLEQTPVWCHDQARGECIRFDWLKKPRLPLKRALARFTEYELGERDEYQITPKQFDQVTEQWEIYGEAQPMPAPYLWADEPGLTFRRLPWPKGVTGPFPLWEEIMSRIDDSQWQARRRHGPVPLMENQGARAFCLFMGAVMDTNYVLQEYLWLHGRGQDSKSAMARMLARLFGPSLRALVTPRGEGALRFFNSQLPGALVGVFCDCDDPDFVTKGHWKSLVGGDVQNYEGKGEKAYTGKLDDIQPKFIFMSQEKPNISPDDEAGVRRLIFIPMIRYRGPKWRTYEDELWEQMGPFLTFCIKLWQDHLASGAVEVLGLDPGLMADHEVGADVDLEFQIVAESHLIFGKGYRCGGDKFHRLINRVWPGELGAKKLRKFSEYLRKNHGVVSMPAKVKINDGRGNQITKTVRNYHGMQISGGL